MNPSILVIEDSLDIADVLRRTLDRFGGTFTVATTGCDGVELASTTRPDVILLDLDLPDGDGLDLIATLREIAPVIVITGRSSEDATVNGFERGADDYVTKPFSPRVLAARVEAALRRDGSMPTAPVVHGPLEIDLARRITQIGGRTIDLTRRELDLLAHLASRPGEVVGRDALLAAVWQSSASWQTPATVTEHVRRIRVKLGDVRWIESVRGVGYRFVVPET